VSGFSELSGLSESGSSERLMAERSIARPFAAASRALLVPFLLSALLLSGCGEGSTSGLILFVDAEFDPLTVSHTSQPIHEANLAVAQTFTVLSTGKFEEFRIVVTAGESADDGFIRITVRPLNGMGEPDDDPMSSIISPIDVDTTTLPGVLVETFTTFDVGMDFGREVVVGETYAIVIEFVSRTTTTDVNAIARVLGQTDVSGDPYVDGTGSTGENLVGFTNNTDDYFFRTFVLR
jgi:hypothetical protein